MFSLWMIAMLFCCCKVQVLALEPAYLNYTEDGTQREPVTVSEATCRCSDCNTNIQYESEWEEFFSKRPCSFCNSSTNAYKRGDSYENVAFNKPATSDSVNNHHRHPPCGATNGILNTSILKCYHSATETDTVPWLLVDLIHVVTFHNFSVNRMHTGTGYMGRRRMLGLDVFLDERLVYAFPSYTQEDLVNDLPLEVHIPTTVVIGRYLRFQKRPYTDKEHELFFYIEICAIMIWVCKPGSYGIYGSGCRPCPETCDYACNNHYGCSPVFHNVAIRRDTTQAQAGVGSKDYPVDGVSPLPSSSPSSSASCMLMDANSSSSFLWWAVHLGRLFKVFSVKIAARQDCCGAQYLKSYGVAVVEPQREFDGDDTSLRCLYRTDGIPTRDSLFQHCSYPMIGNRIFVFSKGGRLGFCTFEAFGYAFYALPRRSPCSETSQNTGCDSGTRCQRGICRSLHLEQCENDDDCVESNVCSNGVCRIDHNGKCSKTLDCRIGSFCSPQESVCKIAYGGSCSEGVGGNCSAGAKCGRHNKCRIIAGGSCSKDSECTEGAACKKDRCTCTPTVSVLKDDLCEPVEGRVGAPCQHDSMTCSEGLCQLPEKVCVCREGYETYFPEFSCRKKIGYPCNAKDPCNTGLVCEKHKCMIAAGESCDGNTELCMSGTTCSNDICSLIPGQECAHRETLCPAGSSCIHGECRLLLGARCSGFEEHCASNYCSAVDDHTCRIPAGEKCSLHTTKFCVAGSTCEKSICKFPLGHECESADECVQDTVCSPGTNDTTITCRLPLGGSGCDGDHTCTNGSICDELGQCRLEKNAICLGFRDLCIHGAKCSPPPSSICLCNEDVATKDSPRCTIYAGMVGGVCSDSPDSEGRLCDHPSASCHTDGKCHCDSGTRAAHSTLSCDRAPGFSCERHENRAPCVEGARCDVDHVCRISAGWPCFGRDRARCLIGHVCGSDGICRVEIHHSCKENPDFCREEAVCDASYRCKLGPGSQCREDEDCMAGSHCNEQRALCECIESVSTLVSGRCVSVAGEVGSVCVKGGCNTLAVCNQTLGVCECQPGFAVDPDTLQCATGPGHKCVTDSDCVRGMTCDPYTETCSVRVGGMCDGGLGQYCITGSVCDVDSMCRVEHKGDCIGSDIFHCKIGLVCDVLGQCNHGAGDRCNASEDEPCIAGAVCVDGECLCDLRQTTIHGVACEPLAGKAAGLCQRECQAPNTNCVHHRCRCQDNFQVDRTFHCIRMHGVTHREGYFGVALGLGAILLALTGFLVGLFVIRKRHIRKAWEELLEKKRLEQDGCGLRELHCQVMQMMAATEHTPAGDKAAMGNRELQGTGLEPSESAFSESGWQSVESSKAASSMSKAPSTAAPKSLASAAESRAQDEGGDRDLRDDNNTLQAQDDSGGRGGEKSTGVTDEDAQENIPSEGAGANWQGLDALSKGESPEEWRLAHTSADTTSTKPKVNIEEYTEEEVKLYDLLLK